MLDRRIAPEDARTASALNHLAAASNVVGAPEQAIPNLQRALRIARKRYGSITRSWRASS